MAAVPGSSAASFEALEGQEEADAWREVLSAEQVERIVEVNRTAMERFGYLPLER